MKLAILLILVSFISGCSTVPAVDHSPSPVAANPEMLEEQAVPPAPAMALPPMPQPASVALEKEVITIPEKVDMPIRKKSISKVALATKMVVESVVSVAHAATTSDEVTAVYDGSGNLQSKTVVVKQDSILADIVKLISLLTGTLGLYFGWKKFQQSPQTT